MANHNVDSLFTNIPQDETIDIYIDNLYNGNEKPPKILSLIVVVCVTVTKESFFTFDNKYYKEVDGAAMKSPLGPDLADICVSNFESKWLRDCLNNFKHVFYKFYVDDIFVLFSSPDYTNK